MGSTPVHTHRHSTRPHASIFEAIIILPILYALLLGLISLIFARDKTNNILGCVLRPQNEVERSTSGSSEFAIEAKINIT